jgi:uncharacterized protein (DUF433 family)
LGNGVKHKTADRNREILAAYEFGHSTSQLAAFYGLTAKSVRQILAMERHRLAVSREAFYANLRGCRA